MENDTVDKLIDELRKIQHKCNDQLGITDIITNSKLFELIIANVLDHVLIPGHSGSRDGKNTIGEEYEYKHYKESSSNHSWTFNDFTDSTITKLRSVKAVIFAHIQDIDVSFPTFDWYYDVPGEVISDYLAEKTLRITNSRKMVNVSARQIEQEMHISKKDAVLCPNPRYIELIKEISEIVAQIEDAVGTTGILTSNKFWEVLVALRLGHTVESEQARHDARDTKGNTYEYKVGVGSSWSFQDISPAVLNKYLENKSIMLATVDKSEITVQAIYEVNSKKVVRLLERKLVEKAQRYHLLNKEVRRQQITLSLKDANSLGAKVRYRAS